MDTTYGYHDIVTDEAMINEMQDLIEQTSYPYVGLRILPTRKKPYKVSERLKRSFHWIDGHRTRGPLNGTSTIGILDNSWIDISRALWQIGHYGPSGCTDSCTQYSGEYIALIAGTHREYGDDIGEHILRNAVILAIWPYRPH